MTRPSSAHWADERERAEAHLRMLAEDEVRHAALPSRTVIRVARVARALTAVGALDDETAKRILDEVELARALRHPAWQASRPVT